MDDWQSFFDTYATKYDGEGFTHNTEAEIPFLQEHLNLAPGARVLDVGCGTGRHSVALAQRGCHVTGVDVSGGMLAQARERARAASVSVEWVHADAAKFSRPSSFDAVLCLCEGAMCLLGAEDDPLEHDLTILRNVFEALLPGGRFVLNVLNACRQIRAATDDDVAAGRFDVLNLSELSDAKALLNDPNVTWNLRERGYTAPEIKRMLAWTGFTVLGIYGGTAGSWGLRLPKLDEYELMVIAEKPDSPQA